jgi:hypothetical protein
MVRENPKPNEPIKKGPLSFVLFESPFTSVSAVSTVKAPPEWSETHRDPAAIYCGLYGLQDTS